MVALVWQATTNDRVLGGGPAAVRGLAELAVTAGHNLTFQVGGKVRKLAVPKKSVSSMLLLRG